MLRIEYLFTKNLTHARRNIRKKDIVSAMRMKIQKAQGLPGPKK